jgi:predicted HicB family RNase H-like nuclease
MPSEVNSPTVRAGAYARYSSDNQSDASINDQIEVCRRYADLQGWEIVEVYPDRALSGASRFRPAFQQMEVDAEACRFDVIIVEALDPLSRKLADMKRRELQKIGVRLPPDVHEWLSAQAERNQSSINSEIIRAIRNAMDRQADRQVPCTTPPHDRSGNGS